MCQRGRCVRGLVPVAACCIIVPEWLAIVVVGAGYHPAVVSALVVGWNRDVDV